MYVGCVFRPRTPHRPQPPTHPLPHHPSLPVSLPPSLGVRARLALLT